MLRSLLDSLSSNELWQFWFDRVQQSCCSCVRSRADVPEGSCSPHLDLFQVGCFPTSDSWLNFRPALDSKGITKHILFRQRNLQCTMNYNLVHASFIHIYYLYIHPQSLQMNYILVTSLQAASILELSYLAWRTKPASFGANSSGNVSPQHPKWTRMIVDDFLGSSTLPTKALPGSQGEVLKLVTFRLLFVPSGFPSYWIIYIPITNQHT